MTMKRPIGLFVVLLAACSNQPLPNGPPSHYGIQRLAPACVAAGAQCKSSVDCCEGFCDTNAYVYSWHTCIVPQANGAYCNESRACTSGICQSYQCVAQACNNLGASCGSDGECCDGSFCDNFTYAPPTCTAPWSKGHYCSADRQCESGGCTDYVCQ